MQNLIKKQVFTNEYYTIFLMKILNNFNKVFQNNLNPFTLESKIHEYGHLFTIKLYEHFHAIFYIIIQFIYNHNIDHLILY